MLPFPVAPGHGRAPRVPAGAPSPFVRTVAAPGDAAGVPTRSLALVEGFAADGSMLSFALKVRSPPRPGRHMPPRDVYNSWAPSPGDYGGQTSSRPRRRRAPKGLSPTIGCRVGP